MKVKIQAGAEFDLLTEEELRRTLASWLTEIHRGARFVRRVAQGVANASGDIVIAPVDFGPEAGFVWDIRRVSTWAAGAGVDIPMYANEITPTNFVGFSGDQSETLTRGSLVLTPNERLVLGGAGAAPVNETVSVNLQAWEVPSQLAWQLL